MKKRSLMLVTVFSLIATIFAVMPAHAQTAAEQRAVPNPIIITEDDINNSFRVTNPPNRRVTDLSIDLQPGVAVHSYTYTIRAPRGGATTSFAIVATLTPSVTNGRIYWTLTGATVDGQPASQDMINQINAVLTSSWRNFIRTNARPGRVTSVTITDTEVQIAYQ